jgi:serine/threonine protein kinase
MDNNYEIRVASLSQARRANPRQLSGPYARIGTGAFGAVYRCSYNMNRAALKVFGGEGVNQEVTQLSYVERHPHIVEYFGELDIAAGQIRNPNAFMRFFGKQPVPLARSRSLLFEFAEHGSLSDYMRRHRRTLSAPMKKRLSRGVLKGLMYLHRLGIIHQDIKSDNILIFGTESRPVAKIGDFGIARCRLLRVVDGEGNTQLATPANFGPGGTGAYMAPEMVQLFTSPATDVARVFELTRRVNSSKIDIFSVGILLWVISTGRLPIRTREDLMAGVVLNNDNHLSQVGVFRRAVQACIAQTPNDRATAEGVLQLLR